MPSPKLYANSADRQKAYRLRGRNVQTPPPIPAKPGLARWKALRRNALHMLEELSSEMRNYAGQRSDAWQESDKAQDFEERIDLVEAARQAAEDIP